MVKSLIKEDNQTVGNLHEKRAHIISVRDRKSRATCHSNVNKTVLSQKKMEVGTILKMTVFIRGPSVVMSN